MLQTQIIENYQGDTKFIGYSAHDDSFEGNRPAILVVHDWSGCNDFAREKADKLAALGYIAFAVDMYGEGRIGNTKEEKMDLMQPLINDRKQLTARITSAYEKIKTLENVNSSLIGAIGFCFGGLCVLDLARAGADVRGVVSFHGALLPPPYPLDATIKSKMLILHGNDDPRVPNDEVKAFEDEMTKAYVDWQLHIYSHTMHSFTNPLANDPNFGTVYNPLADKRSWLSMKNFFEEIFE